MRLSVAASFDEAFAVDNLLLIYDRLKEDKTDRLTEEVKISTGWDRINLAKFEKEHMKHLRALSRRAISGRYIFRPNRRFEVPKPGGGTRPISYPSIRDSVAQRALYQVVGPTINLRLTGAAFAYRPKLSSHDAVAAVHHAAVSGRPWVFESDFKKFFDRLDHERLMTLVRSLGLDVRAEKLVTRFIKTGEVPKNDRNAPFPGSRTIGVPQGGVLSGALANLYLADFDREMECDDWQLIRYADDFVVLCKDEAAMSRAAELARKLAGDIALELHEGKTFAKSINDGIEFVGFHIRGTKVAVRSAKVAEFKNRIKTVVSTVNTDIQAGTLRPDLGALRALIRRIGRKIMGVFDAETGVDRSWVGYFRVINDVQQLRDLDRWIQGEVNAWARSHLHRTFKRQELSKLGMKHMVNQYWSVRRRQGARRMPYTGFLPLESQAGVPE
jgi:group II intron reverse transcriptase/maturase